MKKKVTSSDFLEILDEARRSPSAHNAQPACWSWNEADQEVTLWSDESRRLPIADPKGRDHEISLGAAWEGMSLAFSRRGFSLGRWQRLEGRSAAVAPQASRVPFGRSKVSVAEGPADSLAESALTRRSWRGRFCPPDAGTRDKISSLTKFPGVKILSDVSGIERLARDYRRAEFACMKRADYFAELFHWMRFRRSHRGYGVDGLSAATLGISSFEAFFAQFMMQPFLFRLISRLPGAAALFVPLPPLQSAAAFVLLSAELDVTPFEQGRRFYRLWLQIDQLGLHACPLSALVDNPTSIALVRQEFGLSGSQENAVQLTNILRVGVALGGVPADAGRLSTTQLLVQEGDSA